MVLLTASVVVTETSGTLQSTPSTHVVDGPGLLVVAATTASRDVVVTLIRNANATTRENHMAFVTKLLANPERCHQCRMANSWGFGHFQGYKAWASAAAITAINADPAVESVEDEQMFRLARELHGLTVVDPSNPDRQRASDAPSACENQPDAQWGLVRLTHREPTKSTLYKFPTPSSHHRPTVYVVDTGIYLKHAQFGGRAVWGTNTVDKEDTDENGHGTHMAGLIGGATTGVAKNVTLVAVKVLGSSGAGSTTAVISGLEWICKDHKAKQNR